jgi:hypothetical protein
MSNHPRLDELAGVGICSMVVDADMVLMLRVDVRDNLDSAKVAVDGGSRRSSQNLSFWCKRYLWSGEKRRSWRCRLSAESLF